MSLMTGEEYIESIRKRKMQVYLFGKKVEDPVDDPILRPSLNSVRMTYDLAQMPEYELNHYEDKQSALEFAVAASCLKHSVIGDFNRVNVSDVTKLMGGDGTGRVQR